MLPALPFAIIVAIDVPRMMIGAGWRLPPLLAVAAAVGGLPLGLRRSTVLRGHCLAANSNRRDTASRAQISALWTSAGLRLIMKQAVQIGHSASRRPG
jgi:hypothetical protein